LDNSKFKTAFYDDFLAFFLNRKKAKSIYQTIF